MGCDLDQTSCKQSHSVFSIHPFREHVKHGFHFSIECFHHKMKAMRFNSQSSIRGLTGAEMKARIWKDVRDGEGEKARDMCAV
jgi:hypothetical protein